ncbi:MAG: hypothetical protein K1W41_10100 [Lachnospiraceae bacterium]
MKTEIKSELWIKRKGHRFGGAFFRKGELTLRIARRAGAFLMVALLFLMPLLKNQPVYAAGEGNIDGGGGGGGDGSSTNKWVNGDDGVRVTVVHASNGSAASASVDLTNRIPTDIVIHFTKTCKTSYKAGASLTPNSGTYVCHQPIQSLPTIISSSTGGSRIEQIKRYFTDEQVLRGICGYCGFDFDTLISGDYKLLIEPLAFVTFQGKRTAMTATEAALYDRLLGGTMQRKMPSLSHKNLPLSIFLETSDLGFPAWSGSRTERVTNESIIEALGVGIVRFNEQVTPEIETVDYEYRVNTDVITAVSVRGDQSDPDHPVNVTFQIDGASYTVQNVYYPEGREQLVWVRWHTPPTPQIITISVTATGSGSPAKGTLVAKIVDLDGYDPPNPTADDRNDSYSAVSVPSNMEKTAAHWSIWRPWWQEHWVEHTGSHSEDCAEDCTSSHSTWVDEGWWEFDIDYYSASFSADMSLTPDEKSPTASATTIKSGYGVNIRVNAAASASEASAVTEPQTAVSYFPEFYYETYWRLLERTSGGMNATFQFKPNEYSTYNRRTHFTPIWMKDGSYTVYTYVIDCWTPDGMLCKNLMGSVGISGDLWKDWHIAPKK